MGGQTTMNGNSQQSENGGMLGNVADLGTNLLTLAELQTRLVTKEAQESFARSRRALALLAAGLVTAASALPVLMLGLAELVVEATGVSHGLGLVVVAAGVVGICGLIVGACLYWLKRMQLTLPYSREEAVRNWNWVRTVALRSGWNRR